MNGTTTASSVAAWHLLLYSIDEDSSGLYTALLQHQYQLSIDVRPQISDVLRHQIQYSFVGSRHSAP